MPISRVVKDVGIWFYEIIRCPSRILAQASKIFMALFFYNPDNFLKTKGGLLNITKQ